MLQLQDLPQIVWQELQSEKQKMSKQLYMQFLWDKVVPALVAKWQKKVNRFGTYITQKFHIQQDNACIHITNEEFQGLMQGIPTPGLEIKLYFQPPNSPDLNVLDLCLFRSMSNEYFKCPGWNTNKLHKKVFKCLLAIQ